MPTKRQTTFAKLNRERAVREKRERKQEKRDAAAAEKKARAEGLDPTATQPDPATEPEIPS
jgi:hypothetical protein